MKISELYGKNYKEFIEFILMGGILLPSKEDTLRAVWQKMESFEIENIDLSILPEFNILSFQIGKLLGKGSFAEVKLAENKYTTEK